MCDIFTELLTLCTLGNSLSVRDATNYGTKIAINMMLIYPFQIHTIPLAV